YSVFGHTHPLAEFVADIDVPPGMPPQRVGLDLASGSEAAPGQKTVRVGDQILLAGWRRVDGYSGLDPARRLDYRQPAALRVAGVTWLTGQAGSEIEAVGFKGWLARINRKKIVPDQPIFSMGKGAMWMRVGNPQPRAWLVSKTVFSEDPAVDIAKISI